MEILSIYSPIVTFYSPLTLTTTPVGLRLFSIYRFNSLDLRVLVIAIHGFPQPCYINGRHSLVDEVNKRLRVWSIFRDPNAGHARDSKGRS